MEAFFESRGPGRFRATELTRGPWDVNAQHAGPPAALLARALEQSPGAGQVVRVTVEILRPVALGDVEVSAEVIRPGRNVQLLSGRLLARGELAMLATAWRIRAEDVGMSAGVDEAPPRLPHELPERPALPWSADVGYHTAMEWRFARGDFTEPGPATAWMRMRHPLITGERVSPLSRVMIAADSGNGVSAALDMRRYLFVNTDLTVSLHRHPAGEWVCLDAVTVIQPAGVGVTDTGIFDEQGPLGRGLQSLFVAPR